MLLKEAEYLNWCRFSPVRAAVHMLVGLWYHVTVYFVDLPGNSKRHTQSSMYGASSLQDENSESALAHIAPPCLLFFAVA